MSSSGHYYYKYNGVYYMMPSCQLSINQSYNTSVGKKNKLYEKVQRGEPMFSPFTTWKLQLISDVKEKVSLENQLEKYLENMQFVLYGKGVYIDAFESNGKAFS